MNKLTMSHHRDVDDMWMACGWHVDGMWVACG